MQGGKSDHFEEIGFKKIYLDNFMNGKQSLYINLKF